MTQTFKYLFTVVFSAIWTWTIFGLILWEWDVTKWHWGFRFAYFLILSYGISAGFKKLKDG